MAKKKSLFKKVGSIGTREIKKKVSGKKIKKNIKKIQKVKLMRVIRYYSIAFVSVFIIILSYVLVRIESISVGFFGRLIDIHLYIAQIRTGLTVLIIALLPVLFYLINSKEK